RSTEPPRRLFFLCASHQRLSSRPKTRRQRHNRALQKSPAIMFFHGFSDSNSILRAISSIGARSFVNTTAPAPVEIPPVPSPLLRPLLHASWPAALFQSPYRLCQPRFSANAKRIWLSFSSRASPPT